MRILTQREQWPFRIAADDDGEQPGAETMGESTTTPPASQSEPPASQSSTTSQTPSLPSTTQPSMPSMPKPPSMGITPPGAGAGLSAWHDFGRSIAQGTRPQMPGMSGGGGGGTTGITNPASYPILQKPMSSTPTYDTSAKFDNRGIQGQGVDAATQLAQKASGNPYDYGGYGQAGRSWDCSGFMSHLYSTMTGNNAHFTTVSDFRQLGFQPGYQEGAFNIGVKPLAGEEGHMAGTLPNGVNVESSGSNGVQYGGKAKGALDSYFTQQWHLPTSMMAGYGGGGGVNAGYSSGFSGAGMQSGTTSSPGSTSGDNWYHPGGGGGTTSPTSTSFSFTSRS